MTLRATPQHTPLSIIFQCIFGLGILMVAFYFLTCDANWWYSKDYDKKVESEKEKVLEYLKLI